MRMHAGAVLGSVHFYLVLLLYLMGCCRLLLSGKASTLSSLCRSNCFDANFRGKMAKILDRWNLIILQNRSVTFDCC